MPTSATRQSPNPPSSPTRSSTSSSGAVRENAFWYGLYQSVLDDIGYGLHNKDRVHALAMMLEADAGIPARITLHRAMGLYLNELQSGG